jgi:hypothetical protein
MEHISFDLCHKVLLDASKEVGLEIKMVGQRQSIKIANRSFEDVAK